MILLTSVSDVLQVITAAGSGIGIACHVSYVSVQASVTTPGRQNTPISTATTTQICPSPGNSSTQTNIKYISLCNTGSNSELVTVQHTDGSNLITLANIVLQPNYTLFYNDLQGWGQMDNQGCVLDTPLQGRWLKTTLLTASSSTITTQGSTTQLRIRGVGGGGGGGGCAAVASATGAAGGGGAGGYVEWLTSVLPNTAYAYTCGTAGTNVSGAAGGNGGPSTFVVGATTVTANGGTGGPLCTPVITGSQPIVVAGGAGGVVSTNGSINGGGMAGDPGVSLSLTVYSSGSGGSGPFGGGGLGIVSVAAGNAAVGYGAGGGGSATTAAAEAGGAATPGCWVVDEFS